MRGSDQKQHAMFSYVSPEKRVPAEHPLRSLRAMQLPSSSLCLNNRQLVDTNLIRRPGASDLDWLDELTD